MASNNGRKRKWGKASWIGFFVTIVGLSTWSFVPAVVAAAVVGEVIAMVRDTGNGTARNDADDGVSHYRSIRTTGTVTEAAEAQDRATVTLDKEKAEQIQQHMNRPKPKKLAIDDVALSGNEQADAVINKGKEMIHTIVAENEAIPDADLTYQMDQLERVCTQIFRTVSERPEKAPQIRKFMNYYLPTTLKMLSSYHTMQDRGVSYGDMQNAKETLKKGLDMILQACQKQLDTLYKDTMLDVSTDIDVLEKMLERDGFRDSEFTDAIQQLNTATNLNTTAAASQMASGTPVLKVPESQTDDRRDERNGYMQK